MSSGKNTFKDSTFRKENREEERGRKTQRQMRISSYTRGGVEKITELDRNTGKNGEMTGGSYRLACYSLVPWRS